MPDQVVASYGLEAWAAGLGHPLPRRAAVGAPDDGAPARVDGGPVAAAEPAPDPPPADAPAFAQALHAALARQEVLEVALRSATGRAALRRWDARMMGAFRVLEWEA